MCPHCANKGLIKIGYEDGSEPDFAVCLCKVGLDMRATTNARRRTVPLWHVWAAREQVGPERVVMLEDAIDPDRLTQMGFAARRALRASELEQIGKAPRGRL